MHCVWAGSTNTSPSNTATSFSFPTASFSTTSWGTTEAQRTAPISEDITVTRVAVWLGGAPGAGTSYTFTVRDDGADTAASVTISGTNTTGSWTGSVSIAALSMICMESIPTSTPATPGGSVQWIIEYSTGGNYYLMPYANTTATSSTVTDYVSPISGYTQSTSATATDFEILCPTSVTVTKHVAALDASPGTGKSYALSFRQNNTTDTLTATVSDTNTISSAATGSTSLSAGDTFVIKVVPTGTPTACRTKGCLTLQPSVTGEIISGVGSATGPLTTGTSFQQGYGPGASTGTWSTESARQSRFPGSTISKLYVKVNTAPGTGNGWTFTLRSNGASQSVTATISDTNTSANDTTDSFTHTDGNQFSMQAARVSAPGSTAGAKFSFVQTVTQPSTGNTGAFFPFF